MVLDVQIVFFCCLGEVDGSRKYNKKPIALRILWISWNVKLPPVFEGCGGLS